LGRIVFLILFISGCSASAPVYLPPVATDTEVSAAKSSSLQVELPEVPRRTHAAMMNLYEEAQRSIYPAALSVCREIGEINIQRCIWRFELKEDEAINAYASSNNTITFNTGLIENWIAYEEELSFVLAHEMAHHIANHIDEGTKRINTGVLLGGLIGIAAAQNLDDEEDQLEMLSDGVTYGSQIANLVYSVEAEQEADLIALEILKLSGTNLQKSRNVIVRMVRESERNNRSSFGDTHPTGIERLVAFDQVSANPLSINSADPLDERIDENREGYIKATFDEAIGSYCLYVAQGRKFPVPLVNGCPPIKYFQE